MTINPLRKRQKQEQQARLNRYSGDDVNRTLLDRFPLKEFNEAFRRNGEEVAKKEADK